MFFDISGAVSKFIVVLRCMRNITPGRSDTREVGMNTARNIRTSPVLRSVSDGRLIDSNQLKNNQFFEPLKIID